MVAAATALPYAFAMGVRRAEFLAGVRAEAPLAIGVVPFGMIYGALAIEAGIDALPAQLMSCIVFAGSSQFIGSRLIGNGTPSPIIILTTFVVNLRHALYSLALAPEVRGLSRWWRMLLAYLLTDEAYAGAVARYTRSDSPGTRHYFLFATGLTLWSTWQVSTAAGIFLGAKVPGSWALEFTLALTFIGIIVPSLTGRAGVAAAVAAAAMAVATVHWPYQVGLIVAALTGVTVGVLMSRNDGATAVVPPAGIAE